MCKVIRKINGWRKRIDREIEIIHGRDDIARIDKRWSFKEVSLPKRSMHIVDFPWENGRTIKEEQRI